MQSSPSAGPAAPKLLTALALLWLAGSALRMTILAVAPMIPGIHDDLHMTETQVGLLVGLPMVMFALAGIPGSLLIARNGAVRITIVMLFVIAAASAARAAAFDIWTMYAATLLMGFGIAVMQPALPTLVRNWVPQHATLGSAASTNGLLVGVAAVSSLTIPFILPAVGQSWRLALVVWTIPVVVAGLLFLAIAPSDRPHSGSAVSTGARRWWPDWKNPALWLLGLTMGSNNSIYFAVNAFLPDYLNSRGEGHLIGAALGSMGSSQIVASFLMMAAAQRLQRGAWPYLLFGIMPLAGVFGIVLGAGYWIVAGAILVGFSLAVTFVLVFALPPVLSAPDEVHRMAGGMFTISYTFAMIIPVLCGAIWDLTAVSWTVFVPIGACAVALTVLGFFLSMRAASANPAAVQGDS